MVVLAACGSSSKSGSPLTGGDGGDARTANVTITAEDGCKADKSSFPAGALTMQIKNKDATAVSEVELLSGEQIVGEKENLPPGFSGSFAVQRRRRYLHDVLPRRAAGCARTSP